MTGPFIVIVQMAFIRKVSAPAAPDHPDAGVLFHAPADRPGRFDTEADAEAAIARSLEWAARRGYGWRREDYLIAALEAWEEAQLTPSRRRKKKVVAEEESAE